MRLADLLNRTSVRLALGFALLLIAAFALAGGIAWLLIREQLAAHEDQHILQTWNAIAAELADGQAEVAAAVEEQLAVIPDRSTLILLTDATGAALAGNIGAVHGPSGWFNSTASDLGLPDGIPYRVYAAKLGADRLMVASNRADLHEVGEIVLGALGWGSVAVLIVALGGSAVLAVSVQARMEAMTAAMDRLAGGDLSARMPEEGHGDLARLAGAINLALARLEGLVEGMRQVATDIAHDLRTPLGRLRIRVEKAADQAPRRSDLGTDLAVALEECDAIDATFAGLLRIAQIEAGARQARFACLDLTTVVDRIAEAYGSVAEDEGKTLVVEASGGVPVRGDVDLLLQLLANLVENAIRHGPPGTIIALALRHEGGQPIVTVQDTGPGIPEAERELVLRRLYRLEKSRTTPGNGLGLALVKAIAELHGASLVLDDAAPGLLVTLRFPSLAATP